MDMTDSSWDRDYDEPTEQEAEANAHVEPQLAAILNAFAPLAGLLAQRTAAEREDADLAAEREGEQLRLDRFVSRAEERADAAAETRWKRP